jgi:hypothetical protein
MWMRWILRMVGDLSCRTSPLRSATPTNEYLFVGIGFGDHFVVRVLLLDGWTVSVLPLVGIIFRGRHIAETIV